MPALAALDLPPPFRLLQLREAGDAFAHACRVAPEAEPGTLVRVGRFDRLEFAVTLAPGEPLAGARRAFYAGMVAVGDAIGAHGPPETPLAFGWPNAIHTDGALIGTARLGWPGDCAETDIPDWLVFSAEIHAVLMGGVEPGEMAALTSLEAEAFGEREPILESFARNLMLAFDRWSDEGFAPIGEAYCGRLTRQLDEQFEIDANGDLLVARVSALSSPEVAQRPGRGPSLTPDVSGSPSLASLAGDDKRAKVSGSRGDGEIVRRDLKAALEHAADGKRP